MSQQTLHEITLRIAGRIGESIVDGPGLRYVLFTQGCPHHCPGCHNPETHDPHGGTLVPLDEILANILANPLIHRVTFSGGEPFVQAAQLLPLAQALKTRGFHLMAYTGFTYEALLEQPASLALLETLDMLVDGPFVLAQRSLELPFRGSSNQRVLDVPASLKATRPVLHPVHHAGA